jgi:iron complex transport system substrate-binding protein
MLLAAVGAVVLAGCSAGGAGVPGAANAAGFPMTVSNCGRQVTIPRPPQRVFAERDTSTAVAAAGAANRIVARSGEGDVPLGRYRDQLSRVPQITMNSVDPPPPEVVLGTGADLVVAGHVTRQDVQALEAVGLPVIVPSWFCQQVYGSTAPVTFDDTYSTLMLLGRIFGTEGTANQAVADLQRRVSAVERRFSGAKPRTAANPFVAPSLLQVYGGLSMSNAVLNALGLRNVFNTNQRVVNISSEDLIARNPDVLVLSYGGNYGTRTGQQAMRTLSSFAGLERLTAVRQHRVLTLDYGYLTGGPVAVDGLEILARQLDAINGNTPS